MLLLDGIDDLGLIGFHFLLGELNFVHSNDGLVVLEPLLEGRLELLLEDALTSSLVDDVVYLLFQVAQGDATQVFLHLEGEATQFVFVDACEDDEAKVHVGQVFCCIDVPSALQVKGACLQSLEVKALLFVDRGCLVIELFDQAREVGGF